MADVTQADFFNLLRDHSDMRREYEASKSEIVKEIGKTTDNINNDVKTTGWSVADRVGSEADRVVAQNTAYYIAAQQDAHETSRDIAALKAATDLGMSRMQFEIATNVDRAAAASALESARLASAMALSQNQIERTVRDEGDATRALINAQKISDLERQLVERNTDIIDGHHHARHWRGLYDQNQFQALTSQVQAFQSQLQDTRQGMVNFGSMRGVDQNATTNAVR